MTKPHTKPSTNPDFDSLVPAVGFSRRGFVATALGAGFALAAQPIMAQAAIRTDATGLTAGEIRIGELAAYRAQPAEGGNLPTILVVSEIFGVHEYIADVCRRLARLGYLAIAPELFARHGDPRKLSNVQDILSTIIGKVADREAMADLDACSTWAEGNGGDQSRWPLATACLPGCATRFSRRLSSDLSSGRRGRRLAALAGVVQAARAVMCRPVSADFQAGFSA